MDKLQWFKFAPSDWSMGKIRRCPEVTQARFIMLCCLYWNKECELPIEDAKIEVDDEHYNILLKKKVIKELDKHIIIEFLDEQMSEITETSKSKSKAAKARWDKYNSKKVDSTSNADAMHVHTDAMQNDAEKRREEEEETREDNKKPPTAKAVDFDYDKFLIFINKTFKKSLRVVNDQVKSKIKARLKEGYSKEDFINSVKNCAKDQYHIDNGFKYCTPEYFSRAQTLDKYIDYVEGIKKPTGAEHVHVQKKRSAEDWLRETKK